MSLHMEFFFFEGIPKVSFEMQIYIVFPFYDVFIQSLDMATLINCTWTLDPSFLSKDLKQLLFSWIAI